MIERPGEKRQERRESFHRPAGALDLFACPECSCNVTPLPPGFSDCFCTCHVTPGAVAKASTPSLARTAPGGHLEPETDLPFGGRTFNRERDGQRLKSALDRVYAAMADAEWHSLAWIAHTAGCSEAGASARLRDLRKVAFREHYPNGGIDAKRVGGNGLWMYRMKPAGEAGTVNELRVRGAFS